MINKKQEEICIETQNMHTICTIQYIVLKRVARENKIRSSTEVIWCPFLKQQGSTKYTQRGEKSHCLRTVKNNPDKGVKQINNN